MKKDKKIFSYKEMIICSLIISVFSISAANAAARGESHSKTRKSWCESKMIACIADIFDTCEANYVDPKPCQKSEMDACDGAYGDTSNCLFRPKLTGGFDKKALVPQSDFVAPSPTPSKLRDRLKQLKVAPAKVMSPAKAPAVKLIKQYKQIKAPTKAVQTMGK